MAEEFDESDDDDYFAEVYPDAELTGKEPKFVDVPALAIAPVDLATLNVEELVSMYRQVRDQAATDSKGYRARKDRLKLHMGVLGLLLRDKGDMMGVDSFSTASGTAYRHRTEKFAIQNWDETVAYIKETGNFHILQKRTSPNAIKEIREVDGQIPPGIEVTEEVTFSVRSPTARKRK